ncbi:hypothetical protein BDV3_001937 [Batrachochytrium dendrobatidis]
MHSRKSDYTVASGTTLEFFDGIHKSNRNLSVFPFKADPSSDIAFSRQTTQPLPSKLKSLTTPTLPKLGTGPLHLQFAHSVTASLPSNAAAASADTGSTAFTSHDTPHGFFQHTWSMFSNMTDAQRNQLLKGLMARCSTKQVEVISTCLNLRTAETGSSKVYLEQSKEFIHDMHAKHTMTKHPSFSKIKLDKHREIPSDLHHDDSQRLAYATTDPNTYMNANIYIKLLNSNIDADLISKQLFKAGPEGTKFLMSFLSSRCKKLQGILQTMYEISLEIEMEKAMDMLLRCVMDATEAKHACLYFTGAANGKLIAQNSNWVKPRENVTVNEVFAGSIVFKGESVNIYNIKTSEYYTDIIAEMYHQVDADCILSAPVFGDGMKVAGLIEVINKKSGNPYFNAEDEFMIKALASLGTLLFNHASIKQNAIKKTDDIKVFLNTTSMMTGEKADTGDLLPVIMQTARELVTAERCALFMLDREKEELWSTVAQGSAEIRIPMNKGIAGHVSMTGETLNISDAYADSRFNREIDMRTGFRTRNILCIPMFDQNQDIIGVTQVINKLPEQSHFTKEDETQLSSFSSLAASTIEKQRAFKNLYSSLNKTVQSRTYISGVIQSLNSVILGLNDDGRLVFINNPDKFLLDEILHTMHLTSFEHWLGHDNSQLVDDIIRVKATLCPISGRNYALQLPNQSIRHVNYLIQHIAYDRKVDQRMEFHHITSTKRLSTPHLKKKQPKADTIELQTVTGIMLILDEITAESSLEESLGRQMKPATMHKLMSDSPKLNGKMQKVTVMVANIRGFNAATRGLEPSNTVNYLNNFFETVANVVQNEGGMITSVSGDTATAVFGLPYTHAEDARNAAMAALKLRQAVEELSKQHEAGNLPGIRVGIGLATGNVLSAIIGPPRAQSYTIVGEPVQVAHRLQEIGKLYGVMIMTSESTRQEVMDQFHSREIDATVLQGINSPITLYEIMASSDHDLQHDVMTTLICFELGLSEFRAKNWQAAAMHFKKAIALSDDRPPRTFIERCKGFIDGKYEVAEDWDGVWRFHQ